MEIYNTNTTIPLTRQSRAFATNQQRVSGNNDTDNNAQIEQIRRVRNTERVDQNSPQNFPVAQPPSAQLQSAQPQNQPQARQNRLDYSEAAIAILEERTQRQSRQRDIGFQQEISRQQDISRQQGLASERDAGLQRELDFEQEFNRQQDFNLPQGFNLQQRNRQQSDASSGQFAGYDRPSAANRTAISAYQTVEGLEERDNLEQILGVDLYA
ncbi:hypothetical protein [Thalassotalea euphylliae]|uniref:Uncharacterized protein n=1 Tax=Thalassotalea euphylliae TaxID=1655234 RepID=A0A3E0UEA8_9GAMM|nr:hypothetical protein [Thalassotalea euphylliae]REL35190.1 hypothetical protein DXX92_07360 [Thalassotalea euphylliae]